MRGWIRLGTPRYGSRRPGAIRLGAAVVAVTLLTAAGCKPADTAQPAPAGSGASAGNGAGNGASAGNGGGPAATKDAGGAVTGPAAMAGGDPCALLTPADVRAAFGQTVSKTRRLDASTDEDGTTQQCALVTNGTPMSGAAFGALSAMASGVSGKKVSAEPSGSAIGVTLMSLSRPATAEDLAAEEKPVGTKVIDGLGLFAAVFVLPGDGGFAYGLASPTKGVIIYDLEGRKVAADDMAALLRAAMTRM